MDKAKLMIFNTFYNHLLFDPQSEDEKSIRLLIFGTDKYAAAALKQAFSCGQLQNRNLHIAIVSPQNKNIQTIREKILEEMPGLADLARIGCDWCSDYDYSDIYADIAFVQGDFSNSGIKNTVRYFSPNYIICSVGNDEENVKAASAAASASKNIFTGYICKKKSNASENKKTVPIFPISRIDDINPELRRMAYNTHFIYAKSTSERTLAKYIYEQFNNNEYNGESSYAFALHIKYKLASLGILSDDPYDSAEKFSSIIEGSDRSVLCKLAYYEHRRWCAYSIAEGSQPPPDNDISYISDECSFRKRFTQIETGRKISYHPAIVKSEISDIVLNNFDWEKGSLSGLDPLDKMSVMINRELKKHLSDKDREIKFYREGLKQLTDTVNSTLLTEYDRNIELLLSGNRLIAANLSALTSQLKDKLAALYQPNNSKLKLLTDNIEGLIKCLFIRVEYLKQYDYKAVDFEMISSIPFILQYRNDLVLIQKLRQDYTRSRLHAIKSAIDLEPHALVLISIINCNTVYELPSPAVQITRDIERFEAILKYRQEREFCEKIQLAIVVQGKTDDDLSEEVNKNCADKMIDTQLVSLYYTDQDNGWDKIMHSITDSFRSTSQKAYTIVNGMPEDSIAYSELRNSSFSDLKSFRSCLIKKSYTIEEHMLLHNAEITGFTTFSLSGCYRKLWQLCHDSSIYKNINGSGGKSESELHPENIWNNETRHFSAIMKSNDSIQLGFVPKPTSDENIKSYTTTVLNHIAPHVINVLNFLREYGIVSNIVLGYENTTSGDYHADQTRITYHCSTASASYISHENNKNVEKQIPVPTAVNNLINKIKDTAFSSDDILVCKYNRECKIVEINLSKNFYTADKTNKEIYTPYLEKIIKCLETEKLLTIIKNNKKEDKDKLYFRLAFAELKDILTNAGTLLEVFIYFALKNSGFFNDVISNMKINWKGRSFDSQRKYGIFTQNEIDAAASKDAVTMLISAKNQNFGDSKDNILLAMYEINSLGIQFDAIPVLVSGIPDTIPDRYANRADKMKNMYLIRREDYMVKADELPQNPTYDEIAALEEAKLGKLLIEIIKKYI